MGAGVCPVEHRPEARRPADDRTSSALEVKAVIGDSGSMARSAAPDGFDWHVDGLTAGQVAQRMHVAASAVRYYADQGLLPHDRTPGNQRRFHADVLCRIAMIQVSQRVGLSLAEIRDALTALPPGQVTTPEDWQQLAGRLEQTLYGRIEEMYNLLDDLAHHVAAPSATRDAHAQIAVHHLGDDRLVGRAVGSAARQSVENFPVAD